MRLNAVKMLGISITTSSKKEILEEIQKYLELSNYPIIQLSNKRRKPLIIVTPNPEQIVYAQKNKHFAGILNQADVAIPDGIGISLAAKFLNAKCQMPNAKWKLERIAGVELMEDLVAIAAERGYPIALIGGRGGVAVEAFECLSRRLPGLRGWAMEPGEVTIRPITQSDQLAEKIRSTNTRLVFVGLGAPKQEYVIARLARQFPISNFQFPIVMMSVGGSFDIISGRTPRAPHAIQVAHLEWLWRLIREPWRIKRQLALLQFIWFVMKETVS